MQRYSLFAGCSMVDDDNGPLVRFSDAEAAINAAENLAYERGVKAGYTARLMDVDDLISEAREDMLARCIAVVEAMDIHGCHPYRGVIECNCIGPSVVKKLRVLQEKP